MKARPKNFIIYRIPTFSGDAECYIRCYPQQRWEAKENSHDKNMINLEYKNITLTLPKKEFNNNWKSLD